MAQIPRHARLPKEHEPLARSLLEQGYAKGPIHRHVLLASCFSRWLEQKGIVLSSLGAAAK